MDLTLYQIDAFATRPFEGNPAAIVPLGAFLPDALMQAISAENNLSETAFLVERARGRFELRWFTPVAEVDLCGHATLASAFVVFTRLAPDLEAIVFDTRSGPLGVRRGEGGLLTMDFPALPPRPLPEEAAVKDAMVRMLDCPSLEELHAAPDLMAVFADTQAVRRLAPTAAMGELLSRTGLRGLIATAPSDDPRFDIVSRYFAPNHGIPEDPVTGSAHCILAPYWAARLGQPRLTARQISPRGGTVVCDLMGGRVALSGTCAPYLEGRITI